MLPFETQGKWFFVFVFFYLTKVAKTRLTLEKIIRLTKQQKETYVSLGSSLMHSP